MSKKGLEFLEIPRRSPPKLAANERRIHFKEIYRKTDATSISEQSSRCLDCGNPYCEWKCPVHNYIPNWLTLVQEGKIFEAANLCHQTNSLPEICGRICPQDRLCEGACTINDDFGAVTIGSVEKYITDTAIAQGWLPDLSNIKQTKHKVAIIGAGPAGLACADFLTRNGISVDVYDKYDEIGGLMYYGIPEFKLEKRILHNRKKILDHQKINFYLNTTVGRDIKFKTLVDDYSAVFVSTGAYKPLSGSIKGMGHRSVTQALPYLVASTKRVVGKKLNLEEKAILKTTNERVVVLGGGDTAMDCVRSALRLKAKTVTCLYRRDEKSMPGSAREVRNAREEGTHFVWNKQPQELVANHDGEVRHIKAIATRLKQGQSRGREEFELDHSQPLDIATSKVIIAFGFKPIAHNWLVEENIALNPSNNRTIVGTNMPYQTSNEKVFAGGDMVRGADLVVTAVFDGREAAKSIANYLHVK